MCVAYSSLYTDLSKPHATSTPNYHLCSFLVDYSQSDVDHSLFIRTQGSSFTVVLVYVDDLLIAGNDLTIITDLKTFLADQFKLKDLGTLKYFLGLEMARSPSGIFLSQRTYALDILADFGTLGSRPTSCPMKQHLKLTPEDGVLLFDPSPYRRLVGRLIYLTITRPDISFSINILSQFMQAPREPHSQVALHVLHYLKSSPGHELFFHPLVTFSFLHTLTLIRPVVLPLAALLQASSSHLGPTLFLGEQRNRQLSFVLPQKLNIVIWPPLHVNLFGSRLCSLILWYYIPSTSSFIVIIKLHSTLHTIQSSMSTQNI